MSDQLMPQGPRGSALAQGVRQWLRDMRAGELRLLMLSVALAVAALSAVGFLADRLQAGLWRDARQLLGGDAVIVSDRPTPEAFAQEAQRRGLQSNTSISFPTMARALGGDGASRLVALKAVAAGYPLRGQLLAQRSAQAQHDTIPAPGQVWVDAAVLDALDLTLGQTLALGARELRIGAVIEREPDRGAGFMNFAPRVMMNAQDLASTALVQPASRVTWRMAVVAADAASASSALSAPVASQPSAAPSPAQALRMAQDYATWAQAQIDSGQWRGVQVESLDTGRPEMRQTLDRASQFLHLVALLAALLCAVAVALAAHSFAQQQLDNCALLRVLGQSQSALTRAYAVEFFGAGLLASLLGLGAGWAIHLGFVGLLQELVQTQLPAASAQPAVLGLAVGLTLLLAFGLPPVLQLAQVPALRVIRRDVGALRWRSGVVLGMGLLGFVLTLVVVSRDLKLGLLTLAGFALALLLFAALAALALRGLPHLLALQWARRGRLPQALRLAIQQLRARPAFAVVQISTLALGLMALVLLVLLRTDLIASWRQATPHDAPDRFVINVQPEQTQDFLAHLRRHGVNAPDWYPMVRGRLVAVNGVAVHAGQYESERARRLVEREFNLSYTEQVPAHNPVLAGRWTAGERDGVSVEQGIAQTLGLKLGDTLSFDMGGVQHQARITSLRKVDWASMRANFFMLFPVAQMPEVPSTWLAAFRTPEGDRQFERRLVQAFPNVTSVDMRASLQQVQQVLEQVSRAVEFLFGFTLAAGLLVLLAALGSGRAAREREYAIMRALGAGRQLLVQMQRAELLGIGFLAGFMASAMALLVGWALARWVFDFAWTPLWWVPLVGGAVGAALAAVVGSWSLAAVLRQSVVQTLRQAGQ